MPAMPPRERRKRQRRRAFYVDEPAQSASRCLAHRRTHDVRAHPTHVCAQNTKHGQAHVHSQEKGGAGTPAGILDTALQGLHTKILLRAILVGLVSGLFCAVYDSLMKARRVSGVHAYTHDSLHCGVQAELSPEGASC